MAFYWSLKSVPELAALPEKRRMEIWRECGCRATVFSKVCIALGLVCLTPLCFWIVLSFQSGNIYLALAKSIVETDALVGGCAVACAIVSHHLRIVLSLPAIRKRIGGICVRCGCDIHATPGRCPECGLAVETNEADSARSIEKLPRILVAPSTPPFLRTHRTRFP